MRAIKVSRGMAVAVMALGLVAVGCSKQLPQEVADANMALNEAKDACASVYAPDQLADVQSSADEMNAMADDKKMKKARKAAEPLMSDISALRSSADGARAGARDSADAAIKSAEGKIAAAKTAGADQYASSEYRDANSKMAAAGKAFADPCNYAEAERLAMEAGKAADAARTAAIAEKRRQEEEAARKAEEERRRREEEARRRAAEEEAKRNTPGNYTVVRGDSLWKISGMDKIYKNPIYWPILFDGNGDKIQNPDLIYPGQNLTIGRGMDEMQMDTRLKELWRQMAGSSGM